jgi:hypothetical protein
MSQLFVVHLPSIVAQLHPALPTDDDSNAEQQQQADHAAEVAALPTVTLLQSCRLGNVDDTRQLVAGLNGSPRCISLANSALVEAARHQHVACVKLLLEANASPTASVITSGSGQCLCVCFVVLRLLSSRAFVIGGCVCSHSSTHVSLVVI